MAHYKILGQDPYWMNFFGLMVLTVIEVAAVGVELSTTVTLTILTVIALSLIHI